MSPMIFTLIIILGILIYMVVRQFQERSVQPKMLIILPAILAYYTYTNIVSELAKPMVDPSFLMVCMAVGAILGGLLGWYRGGLVRLRLDPASGLVYSKASTMNIVIWMAVLVIKIATAVALYAGLSHTSQWIALATAVVSTLFLANIIGGNVRLYLRSQQSLREAQNSPLPVIVRQ
ncbi:MAG TPA: hypothetical protein VFB12_17030 [Ktedonobacteraceae bacterium]|nr:hypothetical protein [Ktedonobacteraceae bacterium]